MNDLQKTRIPDKDKASEAVKIRKWSNDYLTIIYALTDASMYLATLEISNDRDAIGAFKKVLNDTYVDLRNINTRIQEIKTKEKWRYFKNDRSRIKKLYKGPFYLEGFVSPYRELMGKYLSLLDQFNELVPLFHKTDLQTKREDFARLQSKITDLLVSLDEWNYRMAEIKIWIFRERSRSKKNAPHKYSPGKHSTGSSSLWK